MPEGQQSLFPSRIERITRLGGTRPIPVSNSSEAKWVQDASGRRWVIKTWMSEVVPNVVHWRPRYAHVLTNVPQFGAMLALDAITHNEDRHLGNILLQPDPDEVHLRACAIDSGSALIGWSDFHAIGLAVPSPRNLAPGIPVDLLEAGALAAAARAAALEPSEILALVSESCEIARDLGKLALDKALSERLAQAPVLVAAYLEKLKTNPQPCRCPVNARFQIVHFEPDPFSGSRFAVGALVESDQGVQLVTGWLPGPRGLGGEQASATVRLILDSLRRDARIGELPMSVGPQVQLGELRPLPQGVSDPAAWIKEHVLHRRPQREDELSETAPLGAQRATAGYRFFETWHVSQWVKKRYLPPELPGWSRPQVVLHPYVDRVFDVDQPGDRGEFLSLIRSVAATLPSGPLLQ